MEVVFDLGPREKTVRLIAVLLLLYVLLGFRSLQLRLDAAREEERELEAACALRREENEALRREFAAVREGDALEAVARERLGLVRPGEKIYYFD